MNSNSVAENIIENENYMQSSRAFTLPDMNFKDNQQSGTFEFPSVIGDLI